MSNGNLNAPFIHSSLMVTDDMKIEALRAVNRVLRNQDYMAPGLHLALLQRIRVEVREAMDRMSGDDVRRWHVFWLAHQNEYTTLSERLTTGEWMIMIIEMQRFVGTAVKRLFVFRGDLRALRRSLPGNSRESEID